MRKLLRFVCILLTIMCLTPVYADETGDNISLLRGWNKQDGYEYLTLGTFPQTKEGAELPILWRVLTVEGDKALILSEYVLEARPLHSDYKEYANKPTNKKNPGFNGDYTQTDMAQYLGGEFTANFAESELAALAEDETLGMFFLLSGDDLKNAKYGFTSNESRKAWGTDYAKENGLFVYGSHRGNHSPYWTRTQSTTNIQAARCIKSKGEIGYINVITEDEGVRPACWLDLTKIVIPTGTGTKDAPYGLDYASAFNEEVWALENQTTED